MDTLDNFVTYHKFSDKNSAEEFSELLQQNSIVSKVVNNSPVFDASFANNETLNEFQVKIQSQDFIKAQDVLVKYYKDIVNNVDSEYYLFQFSNVELLDILKNSEEWSEFDVALAHRILNERNVSINTNEIQNAKEEKIKLLSEPEKAKPFHLVLGYIFAVLGGVFGVFYGWYLKNYKKTLPNGERIYQYQNSDRKHGSAIMNIGIVCSLLWLIYTYVR